MANHGFVYILGNAAMPGILKIGMTDRSPYQRADELSASTAAPLEFQVLAICPCVDARQFESAIHDWLSGSRVNSSREFFRLSFSDAVLFIDGETPIHVTEAGARYAGSEIEKAILSGIPVTEGLCALVGKLTGDQMREIEHSIWFSRHVDIGGFHFTPDAVIDLPVGLVVVK